MGRIAGTKKLSEIVSVPIIHCEFNETVVVYFSDDSRLESTYSDGHYGTGTAYADTEVRFFDKSKAEFYVEVDTQLPVRRTLAGE